MSKDDSNDDDAKNLQLIQELKNGHGTIPINGQFIKGAFVKCGLEKKLFGKINGHMVYGTVWSVFVKTTLKKYDLFRYTEKKDAEIMVLLLEDLIETVRLEDYDGHVRVKNWISSGPYFGNDSRNSYNLTKK